ncbi:MAG TPA: hypothetical protein PKO33_13595, partial [Pyrinomonadaceae bacterium]|nr:hypothetical protein [Pyrinomonadaceae bacterium]
HHPVDQYIRQRQQFRRLVREAKTEPGSDTEVAQLVAKALAEFEAAMDDDLNTSVALAAIHNLVRETNSVLAKDALRADDRESVLDAVARFDSVLGIFGKEQAELLDAEVEALIDERQEARRNRNFARSDEIRDLLAQRGIVLEDTKDGVRWKRK